MFDDISPEIRVLESIIKSNSRKDVIISNRYRGKDKKLTWTCIAGHIYHMTPREFIYGDICDKCVDNKSRLELAMMPIDVIPSTYLDRFE